MITSLVFKAKVRPQKHKKARYAIRNVSKKDLSKIIKEFERFEKLTYENKRPKHEPTDRYFNLEKQLAKCMMRYNDLNWHDHRGYTEMMPPYLNINATDKDESKHIIVHETLSENCSTDVSKSKQNIVNKNLLQNNYANVSENIIMELKDKEYTESSVTKEVKCYYKII